VEFFDSDKTKQLQAEHPDEPWKWREDWAAARLVLFPAVKYETNARQSGS